MSESMEHGADITVNRIGNNGAGIIGAIVGLFTTTVLMKVLTGNSSSWSIEEVIICGGPVGLVVGAVGGVIGNRRYSGNSRWNGVIRGGLIGGILAPFVALLLLLLAIVGMYSLL